MNFLYSALISLTWAFVRVLLLPSLYTRLLLLYSFFIAGRVFVKQTLPDALFPPDVTSKSGCNFSIAFTIRLLSATPSIFKISSSVFLDPYISLNTFSVLSVNTGQ